MRSADPARRRCRMGHVAVRGHGPRPRQSGVRATPTARSGRGWGGRPCRAAEATWRTCVVPRACETMTNNSRSTRVPRDVERAAHARHPHGPCYPTSPKPTYVATCPGGYDPAHRALDPHRSPQCKCPTVRYSRGVVHVIHVRALAAARWQLTRAMCPPRHMRCRKACITIPYLSAGSLPAPCARA